MIVAVVSVLVIGILSLVWNWLWCGAVTNYGECIGDVPSEWVREVRNAAQEP